MGRLFIDSINTRISNQIRLRFYLFSIQFIYLFTIYKKCWQKFDQEKILVLLLKAYLKWVKSLIIPLLLFFLSINKYLYRILKSLHIKMKTKIFILWTGLLHLSRLIFRYKKILLSNQNKRILLMNPCKDVSFRLQK